MEDNPTKQVLALMLVLLGFNTLAVAFSLGYSFSLQHQIDQIQRQMER